MSIDQAFILSAGLGTRMGDLGKLWPKPLWNLFETTLLGLQIKYVQSLGIKSICVNTHHQRDKVEAYLNEFFPDVKISFEEKLLGSGGGVHQVINNGILDRSRPIAVLNSDSFLFVSKDLWGKLNSDGLSKDVSAALFMSGIKTTDHYNAVIFNSDGKMLSIEKEKDLIESPVTYSGFGIVYPKNFERSEGESSFFSSVADYKNREVFCQPVKASLIDFGTLDIYKKIIATEANNESDLYKFLKKFDVIDESKIFKNGYGQENVFNFAGANEIEDEITLTIGRAGKFEKKDNGVGLYLP